VSAVPLPEWLLSDPAVLDLVQHHAILRRRIRDDYLRRAGAYLGPSSLSDFSGMNGYNGSIA
jgi:hypothetical protein